MRADVFFVALSALCLSGCIAWDAGYTANAPVRNCEARTDEKIPIGYSIVLKRDGSDVAASPDASGLREKVEMALKDTGLFSEVTYGARDVEESYHLTFRFHQGYVAEAESSILGMLSGCTFTLVPNVERSTFDGIAELALQGKILYTSAKAEEVRYFIWLPVLPAGLFMNSWSAWGAVETGTVNALVNDVADFHRKRFQVGNAR
jgi:hypothetical protein